MANDATSRAHHDVRAREWSAAETHARRARRWAPWSSNALEWLGEAQVGAGKTAAGRATLRRAIARDRRNWELWFDLALALPRGGSAQTAALLEARKLNPLSPEVREFVAGTGLKLPAEGR
jgi:Flp pilus assembly protein TadD